MEVLLANEYGFCFGVERAVEMVEDALGVGAPVRTLGPLIHNTQEMQRLECEGVSTVQDPAEVSKKGSELSGRVKSRSKPGKAPGSGISPRQPA